MSLKEFIEDYHYQYNMRYDLLLDRCMGNMSRLPTKKLTDFELRDIYEKKEDIRKFLPYIGIRTIQQ